MIESTRRIIPFDSTDCDPPELLTVEEAAGRYNTTGQTVRNKIAAGMPSRRGERRKGAAGRRNVIWSAPFWE
jgi:hypothetical protein